MAQAIPYIIAAGAAYSSNEQQQRATRLQKKAAEGRAATERRNIVRQERIRRAQILNASANQGTQGSSSEQAAVGSVTSQSATNLGQSFAFQSNASATSNRLQKSQDLSTASSLISGAANTYNQYFN